MTRAFICPCCGRGANAKVIQPGPKEDPLPPTVELLRCEFCRKRYTAQLIPKDREFIRLQPNQHFAGDRILTPYKPKRLTARQFMARLFGGK